MPNEIEAGGNMESPAMRAPYISRPGIFLRFSEELALQFELTIRKECAGMRFYVLKHAPGYIGREVKRAFNGRNIDEITKKLSIHRATAYRLLKRGK